MKLLVKTAFCAIALASCSMKGEGEKPLFDERFLQSTKATIDRPLVVGSARFGAGLGPAGLCPGPAISAAALGNGAINVFLITLVAGMFLKDGLKRA